MYYDGSSFVSFSNSNYDIKDFTTLTADSNNAFSNTITTLPSGVYCLVLNVKSSSSVVFTDVLGFVVRKGLTTTISGSYHKTGESSGSIYIKPVENEKPATSTTGVETISPPSDNSTTSNPESGTVVGQITNGMIYKFVGDNNNETVLGHYQNSTTDESRLNIPTGTKFAMNLNGTNVYLSKLQNNGSDSESESAMIADLKSNSFMTIYNNSSTAKSASFAILLDTSANKNKVYHKRLQSNIQVDNSTLNIVGEGSQDNISNAGITFFGPRAIDINVPDGYKRQGSINLIGVGGTINLDGNVSVQGVYGISSWSITGAKTLIGSTTDPIKTQINLLHGANISTNSDDSAVKDNKGTVVHCESAEDRAFAHGIYLDGNKSVGSIEITLSGKSSINTTCSSNPSGISAGIRIENFTGTLKITLDGSSINATNGYGIYLNNCSNVEIELLNGASINGDRGALSYSDSTVTLKVNGNTTNNPTNTGKTIM